MGQPKKGFILFFGRNIAEPKFCEVNIPDFAAILKKTTPKINFLTIFHCQLILQKIFKNEDFISFKFCTTHFYWPFILNCIIKKLEACINNKISMASGTFSLFVSCILFIIENKKLILLLAYSILMKHFTKKGQE